MSRAPAKLPPKELLRLSRFYPVKPVRDGDGWKAELPDGSALAWDDGAAKSYAQKLERPDLEDTFSIPYRPGAIAPVRTPNDDPGRIRSEALLRATYGGTEDEVRAHLVTVPFFRRDVEIHEKVAPALERVRARLEASLSKSPKLAPYLAEIGRGFNWRTIAQTDRLSTHAFGIALDLAVPRSHYWLWQKDDGAPKWANEIPQEIVDAFEAEGFIWGGRWYHYDTMHFEYRPELLTFDDGSSLD